MTTSSQSYQLRDYQVQVVRETYSLIRKEIKRILIYAPTGAGKTVIASKMVLDAVSRGRRVLFLVHRDTLIIQTLAALQRYGLDAGIVKAGYKEDRKQLIQVASIQSLARRRIPPADLIICDECHTLSYFNSFERLLKFLPGATLIGFTATPWRLKRDEGLGSIYKGLVCAPQPKELIQRGYLVPPRYFGYPIDLDLAQVKTVAGEFDAAGLEAVCNSPRIISRMVEEYQRLSNSRRAIVFAVSIAHSLAIKAAFNAVGVPAEHLDASTPSDERQAIFSRVKSSKTLVLSSVGVLTEGFDIPEISCVILARPTKSKALNLQMVGRGLRIAPWDSKTDCVIMDFAENTKRHGFVTEEQNISLEKPDIVDSGDPPVKLCPECSALVHIAVMVCPECGYEFPPKVKVERLVDLVDLAAVESDQYEFYATKARLAFHNRYAPGWASAKFKDKYGVWPPRDWQKGVVFAGLGTEADKKAYEFYLEVVRRRMNKSDIWVKQQMAMEFWERGFVIAQKQHAIQMNSKS